MNSKTEAFRSELASFVATQEKSWETAAFLCKRACGRAIYEKEADWLEELSAIIMQHKIWKNALSNLCAALLFGVEREKKNFRLVKKWQANKKFQKPENVQNIEGFKNTLKILDIARKNCGAATETACASMRAPKKPAKTVTLAELLAYVAGKALAAEEDEYTRIAAWIKEGEKI